MTTGKAEEIPLQLKRKIFRERDSLAELLGKRRQQNRVVFTNGCFDILHRGHAIYLCQARALGELLVVGLNSDRSVEQLKGSGRPLNSWEDRAILLSALYSVDFVLFFDEDTPVATIERLRPDIHCKGGDYRRQDLAEGRAVEQGGGRIVILPFIDSYSTTNICKKIEARGKDALNK